MSTKRKYSSSLRESQAAKTRSKILDSARKLLAQDGFDGATIAAIAKDAGVSAQTIYSVFGSKGAIVAGMMTYLESEAGESEFIEQLQSAPNARGQLKVFTSWIKHLFDEGADIFSVVLQSPNQPELAEIRKKGDERRLIGCKMLTQQWSDAGDLRIDAEEAASQMWLTSNFEIYQQSVANLGWNSDKYELWLYETAERLLFVDVAGQSAE
jgi:AcrR family transcriptional regulator